MGLDSSSKPERLARILLLAGDLSKATKKQEWESYSEKYAGDTSAIYKYSPETNLQQVYSAGPTTLSLNNKFLRGPNEIELITSILDRNSDKEASPFLPVVEHTKVAVEVPVHKAI